MGIIEPILKKFMQILSAWSLRPVRRMACEGINCWGEEDMREREGTST